MGLILKLKRKTYSDDEGMSTGKKVALGIAGTAATAGAAFLGAKKGVFGANAVRQANMLQGKAGLMMNNAGMKIMGNAKKGLDSLPPGQTPALPGGTPNLPAIR